MTPNRCFVRVILAAIGLSVGLAGAAVVPDREPSRFDPLVRFDPPASLGVVAEVPEAIPGFEKEAEAWRAFRSLHGDAWRVYVDRRSGAPLLVEGPGMVWFSPDEVVTLGAIEAKARALVRENSLLFKVRQEDLVLDPVASGPMSTGHWTAVFNRVVDGIPVENEHFVLYVTHGRLTAFGADRWGEIGRAPEAVYSADTAREILLAYMGNPSGPSVREIESGTAVLVAAAPAGSTDRRWLGAPGAGIRFHLAYRFALQVTGERGTWVGKVDAVTGEVLALYDDQRYSQVKGGVYPVSNDQICPDGCEQSNYPMPWSDIVIDGVSQTANDFGVFDCSPFGGTARTTLAGPYIRIFDYCGAVNETATCDADIDLQSGPGTDCVVPAGRSAGDTHSSRSSFYHLNRSMEKGRHWLPSNTWLQNQLTCNVNINSTCNAYWNGSVNFYKSGGGCRNTGEIAAVFVHEWGHGIDQNDGGGYDNPSEAYADVVAILYEHDSCVGRGFFESQTCSGYGDTCLTCTGIRDMDYDKRQSHTPATPANFTQPNCGGGGGPCGREEHCESYPPSEVFFDLATRDLPASGMDLASAWQLSEKLFYKSRQGSGGNAYNCSLPNSDGCGATTWFTKIRNIDDDDGNLSNGTPHAAAIYAAFNRHALACGNANDASNQTSSSCPTLSAPSLTGKAGSASASLTWTDVPQASSYSVLRTEFSCNFSQNVIANVAAPNTTYTDSDIADDFTVYYRVQAQGANPACESAVSNCVAVTPQPFAGSIKLGQASYACTSTIQISVRDANIGSPTTTATIFSGSEPSPETVVLTETSPGSARYLGTILASSGPAIPGDGVLSIANGEVLTARYLDADDGLGGTNLTRETTAVGDCVGPLISLVQTTGITDVRATITWATDEGSNSVVRWGEVKPPSSSTSDTSVTTAHSVTLTGLRACTVYWYQVESQDRAGNVAVDNRGGQYFYFETLGDLGSGLQGCHAGRVTLPDRVVNCADSLPIKVTDLDLNLSPTVVDAVTVSVTSSTETIPEVVTLAETGPNTSQFTGSIATAPAPPVGGDGLLQATNGDIITATYQDANDGTGASAVSFATSDADCAAAKISGVRVTSITDESAVLEWTTGELTTGEVTWGMTPALGSVASSPTLKTNHSVTLRPINECGRFHFRVKATDAYGHVSTLDAAGAPYEANSSQIGGALFKDAFEASSGWTLEGEWQIGAPQGRGSNQPDPTAAFEGTKVLGQDLTGAGANPGDYEPNTTQRAVSPTINASALVNGQLRFRRWLNVAGPGAEATVSIRRSGQTAPPVWTSTGNAQTGWSLETLNVGSYTDGASAVQIVFQQRGGSGPTVASGWNIDRLVLRSANAPDYVSCGGCGGAPTFSGALSATDADPCGDSGILVSWNAAPAWGTGSSGTYSVYRDTAPNFTPQPSNRIAAGINATSFTDTTAPNNVALFYIVRAENNETCSVGPNNGGVTEGNLVVVQGRDELSQGVPAGLGGSLAASVVNEAHVRLSWAAAANAVKYNVYRAQSPQGPFSRVATTSSLLYEDRDQMGNSTSWYYDVKGANACNVEGP